MKMMWRFWEILNSITDESVRSLEEDEEGYEHYVGGFSVIGPNMSIKLTLLREFNKIWEPPFNFIFLKNHDINKVGMLAYLLLLLEFKSPCMLAYLLGALALLSLFFINYS